MAIATWQNGGRGVVTELVLGGPRGRATVAWALAREVFSINRSPGIPARQPFSILKDAPHLTLTSPGHTVWRLLRGKNGGRGVVTELVLGGPGAEPP